MAEEQEQAYYAGDETGEPPASFYSIFRDLHRETSDSIGGEGKVDQPREYRFDIEFPERRYAYQGYPTENRIFVGQYLGDRGVIWFDEIRYDALHHGWRAGELSAWDFAKSLLDKRSLTYDDSIEKVRQVPQSSHKESPTSLETAAASLPEAQAEKTTRSAQASERVRRRGLALRVRQLFDAIDFARDQLSRIPGPRRVIRTSIGLLVGRRKKANR